MEIIHTRGSVNRYLKLAPGRASLSIMKMAREGLLPDLRNAIAKAKKENVTVRKHNIQIKNGNGNGASRPDSTRFVNFEVVPVNLGNLKELYFMIVFEDSPAIARPAPASHSARATRESEAVSGKITRLEQELAATKEYLQSVIETQQATNEELQSANEEILSSNEELQSTNEELETAKEELQATNEELATVNDELQDRIRESIVQMVADVALYVPGYRLKQEVLFTPIPPDMPIQTLTEAPVTHQVSVFLEVEGAAHYLPAYAGNLDIMTSAALRVAERLATDGARRTAAEVAA